MKKYQHYIDVQGESIQLHTETMTAVHPIVLNPVISLEAEKFYIFFSAEVKVER